MCKRLSTTNLRKVINYEKTAPPPQILIEYIQKDDKKYLAAKF